MSTALGAEAFADSRSARLLERGCRLPQSARIRIGRETLGEGVTTAILASP
jgi:hypothetical protein